MGDFVREVLFVENCGSDQILKAKKYIAVMWKAKVTVGNFKKIVGAVASVLDDVNFLVTAQGIRVSKFSKSFLELFHYSSTHSFTTG